MSYLTDLWLGNLSLLDSVTYDLFKMYTIELAIKYIVIFCFISQIQSIVNHMYWVASSSSSADEKQEKWESIINHIVDIHVHKEKKIFTKCTHIAVEREWLKQGVKI